MSRAAPQSERRGDDLMREYCMALTRLDEADPPAPAFRRVEQLLGGRLARLLVGALSVRLRARNDTAT